MADTYVRVSDVRDAVKRIESVFDKPQTQALVNECMAVLGDVAKGDPKSGRATKALFEMLLSGGAGQLALLVAYAELSRILNGPRVTPPADWEPETD